MLVREIITSAFCELQLYSPGEQLTNVDLARGFQSANTMLDMWTNENLFCYATLEQSLQLIPGQAQYSLGPGGYVQFRPLRIKTGQGAAYVQDANGNNYAVNVITVEEWNSIGNRVISNSNFPDTLYYSATFPLGVINMFPVPNMSYTLFFDSYQELTAFPSVDVDLNLPRGYSEAIYRNLAIAIKPMYPMAKLSQETVALASRSVAAIKRTNSKLLVATYDAELGPRGVGTYDIYIDGYSNSSMGR